MRLSRIDPALLRSTGTLCPCGSHHSVRFSPFRAVLTIWVAQKVALPAA